MRVFYRSGESDGTWVWENATLVNASSNVDLNDLTITEGGAISGTVTKSDGTAFEGIWVDMSTERCGGNWVGGVNTDSSGVYNIDGLPPTDVYVHVWPGENSFYDDLWYDGNSGIQDCNSAMPVTVIAGPTIENIDFTLEASFTIEGFRQTRSQARWKF